MTCSAVSIQYRSANNGQTDGQTDGQNCYINIKNFRNNQSFGIFSKITTEYYCNTLQQCEGSWTTAKPTTTQYIHISWSRSH